MTNLADRAEAGWQGVKQKPPGFQDAFRKIENPEPGPGCYSLDLYCDHENPDHVWAEFPHGFIGASSAQCRADAKRRGWKIHRDRTATCPKCTARLVCSAAIARSQADGR